MPYEPIHEPIEVLCRFKQNRIVPEIFYWHNREHRVVSVNSIHTSREGIAKLVHFSISTNTSVFKITFNTNSLEWMLEEVYVE